MENNLNKGYFYVKVILGAILLLIILGGLYLYTKRKADAPVVVVPENNLEILGNKEDLVSFSVKPGDIVSGILNLTGSVKNAYFSEGNILVSLLDENQNVLKKGYGSAKTEWMTTEPVSFSSTIDSTGLNGPGYILIQNDDPSSGEGGPAKKILIPVIFQNNLSINNIYKENDFKKFTRDKYSFYAPSEWIESSSILTDSGKFTGCELYSVNFGGDGHRMGGAVNIYLDSCFNPSTMELGDLTKENTRKNGYYIFAQYNEDSTLSEQIKTKEVYKKIIETFTLNKETMTVKLYFGNKIFNPEMLDCSLVYPVDRIIPYTQAVATATLNELIKGPTFEEKKDGYFSSIPADVKVNSIKMEGSTLLIDFNEAVMGGGGSCGQMIKGSSIFKTLQQFPTIKDIKMTINGKGETADLFQP